MENQRIVSSNLEGVESRLYDFFADILERSSIDKPKRKKEEDASCGKPYQSIWEFWENEL